jgi:hypothetical protein
LPLYGIWNFKMRICLKEKYHTNCHTLSLEESVNHAGYRKVTQAMRELGCVQ